MIRIACGAVLALAAFARPLAAQDVEEACPGARTQTELNYCAAQRYTRADSVLNHRYREVMRTLEAAPERAEALRAAQRAWIRFRDAQCAFQASRYEGGSMQPMIRLLCLETVTRDRAEGLANLLADEG